MAGECGVVGVVGVVRWEIHTKETDSCIHRSKPLQTPQKVAPNPSAAAASRLRVEARDSGGPMDSAAADSEECRIQARDPTIETSCGQLWNNHRWFTPNTCISFQFLFVLGVIPPGAPIFQVAQV